MIKHSDSQTRPQPFLKSDYSTTANKKGFKHTGNIQTLQN